MTNDEVRDTLYRLCPRAWVALDRAQCTPDGWEYLPSDDGTIGIKFDDGHALEWPLEGMRQCCFDLLAFIIAARSDVPALCALLAEALSALEPFAEKGVFLGDKWLSTFPTVVKAQDTARAAAVLARARELGAAGD